MIGFAVGFFLGFYIGIGLMALLAVSRRAEDRAESMRNKEGIR